jgi:hypothetical protein
VKPTTVVAPDVVGMPRSEALCHLAERRLRWRLNSDKRVHSRPPGGCADREFAYEPNPRIVRQIPPGEEPVPLRAVITLVDECERERRRSGRPDLGCA